MIKRNAQLKRSTPLCRKPRAPVQPSGIRYSSLQNRKSSPVYIQERNRFLLDNPVCNTQLMAVLSPNKYVKLLNICEKKASTVHHMLGRNGENLTDSSAFMGLCVPCHQFIHDHPNEGILLGYYL